jgi:hypothetical protein
MVLALIVILVLLYGKLMVVDPPETPVIENETVVPPQLIVPLQVPTRQAIAAVIFNFVAPIGTNTEADPDRVDGGNVK